MSTLIERETSAGSEGARRATGDPAGRAAAGVPDPEVSEQAKRRRFKAEYKLQIVREMPPMLHLEGSIELGRSLLLSAGRRREGKE